MKRKICLGLILLLALSLVACGKGDSKLANLYEKAVASSDSGNYRVAASYFEVIQAEGGYDKSEELYAAALEQAKAETGDIAAIPVSTVSNAKDGHAHEWAPGSNGVAATCLEYGYQEYVCSKCGEIDVEIIAATGHSLGEWEAENGEHVKKCANCDYAEKHDPDMEESLADDALHTKCKCTVCGIMETIDNTDYKEVKYNFIPGEKKYDLFEDINLYVRQMDDSYQLTAVFTPNEEYKNETLSFVTFPAGLGAGGSDRKGVEGKIVDIRASFGQASFVFTKDYIFDNPINTEKLVLAVALDNEYVFSTIIPTANLK